MKVHATDKAPAAIGPYSQAIESQGFLFCSGQIGLDPVTGEMKDGLEAQIAQILQNIEAVLTNAGLQKEHVVKSTIFITDMNDFPTVNEKYGAFFGEHKPARSTVGVAALPKGAVVEIEIIAERS